MLSPKTLFSFDLKRNYVSNSRKEVNIFSKVSLPHTHTYTHTNLGGEIPFLNIVDLSAFILFNNSY